MKRVKNGAVLISLLSVAVGCATVSYQEPNSGPRARIRFVADYQDITVVHQFDDEDCKSNDRDVTRLRSGFIGPNTNRKSLGIPLPPPVHENARSEIFVVAGQPFHGMFMGLVTSTIFSIKPDADCRTVFSFVPEEGQDYEAEFLTGHKWCSMRLFQIIRSNDGSLIRKPKSTPPKEPGQCETALKKAYVY